jgi:hypothetical protein
MKELFIEQKKNQMGSVKGKIASNLERISKYLTNQILIHNHALILEKIMSSLQV